MKTRTLKLENTLNDRKEKLLLRVAQTSEILAQKEFFLPSEFAACMDVSFDIAYDLLISLKQRNLVRLSLAGWSFSKQGVPQK